MGTAGGSQEPGGGACLTGQCNAQQGLGAGGMHGTRNRRCDASAPETPRSVKAL